MYSGNFIYPGYYSIGEYPSQTKIQTVVNGIMALITYALGHEHTGGNDGTQISTLGIADLAVTTDKLYDGAVTTAKITDLNVTTAKINNLAVTNAKLGAGAVTFDKIAGLTIVQDNMASNSVSTAKLVDACVTNAKLGNLSVTSGKIAAAAVTTDKLGTGAVQTINILDNNVTLAKLSNLLTTGVGGAHALIPRGVIVLWSGAVANVPQGWGLCDGTNSTPDLRDRFVVGAGNSYAVGAVGGSATQSHTFGGTTAGNLSPYSYADGNRGEWNGILSPANHTHTYSGTTSVAENRPPYFALCYIMKL